MNIVKARNELLLGKTIYDMKLKVADYSRVSTDKEDQQNSLKNQVNYFTDMIEKTKNWEHVGSYVDEGISGTMVYKRDNFLRMMEDARLGKIDLILTKEVSRFARNTIDSIKYTQLLLEFGVIVFFVTDNINTINPDSEFRLTIMSSMAQDEVRKLSQRVKFGVKRSIESGKVGGGPITGYIKEKGKLTINPKEVPIIEKLFSWYATGKYGFTKIGEMLAEEGYYTKKGKVYSDITLKKMLQNPRYKGYYTANLSEVVDYKTHKKKKKPREEWIVHKDTTGAVPAIVSEELWDRANEIYKSRTTHWNKTVLNKQFYLENRVYTSKLFCTEHNTTFIRCASGKRKNNPVWQCNEYLRHGIKGCKTPRLYEKHLNQIFTDLLEKFIDNKDLLLKKILNDYKKIISESKANIDVEAIDKQIKEQTELKDRLLDMSLRRIISEEEFVLKNNKIISEISELKQKKHILEAEVEDVSVVEQKIKKIEKEIKPKLDVENNLNEYFNNFIDKVFVSKINNDRFHLKLDVVFNFNNPNVVIDYDINEYVNIDKGLKFAKKKFTS